MSRHSSTAPGLLFKHQSQLPKLPVPTLDETLSRYLESVKPLANQQEYANTLKVVNDFKNGMGPVLQKRLVDRSNNFEKGWLADWWNEYAYMGYRDPVVVYVNYFFAFADDKLHMEPSMRAATIITGAMLFRDKVISGDLEPERTKAGPLCSEQYKYLFNSTRIPKIPSDITKTSDYSKNNYIVVIRKNQFYKLDLTHPNGVRLNTAEIKQQLDYIYRYAAEPEATIGIFTTENRDTWTKIRQELIEASPQNKLSLEIIEDAAFTVCLDDTKPVTKNEHSRVCWHGDGRNRFFDKSMQFIINDNGKAGFNGEHSMMEATITHRACDFICQGLNDKTISLESPSIAKMEHPKKLNFDLNQRLYSAMDKAGENFDKLIAKYDLEIVTYQAYGKSLIKKFGVSPDAYAQMAIQLAYFKLYNVSRATYESAGTRKFAFGRTETGRSVSVESVEWVKAMQDPYVPIQIKGMLGRKAIKSQSSYMAAAGDGKGVDRHFLGLKLLLRPDEPKPEIFVDPIFQRSCHWNLSTSQVTSEHYDGYGWGPVVDDGYGCAYMVKQHSLQFNLTSKFLKNQYLATYFHEALNEMRVCFEATVPAPKAKL